MDPSNPDPGIIKLIDRLVDEATSPEEETLYVSSSLKTDILVITFIIYYSKNQVRERHLCVHYYHKLLKKLESNNATVRFISQMYHL